MKITRIKFEFKSDTIFSVEKLKFLVAVYGVGYEPMPHPIGVTRAILIDPTGKRIEAYDWTGRREINWHDGRGWIGDRVFTTGCGKEKEELDAPIWVTPGGAYYRFLLPNEESNVVEYVGPRTEFLQQRLLPPLPAERHILQINGRVL